MNLRAATCLALLWSLTTTSLGQAPEPPVIGKTPRMLVPVGSYSADEVAAALNLAFVQEADISCTPVPSRSMVIVHCPQERRGEVLQMMESLTPPINPIWVRVIQLQTTGDLSAQERARLSGPVTEVAQSIEELQASGRLQLVHDAEMTVLPDIQGRLQMGEQVAIRTGSSGMPMGPNRAQVHYEWAQVGTILTIQADSDSELVTLQLNFESSSRPNLLRGVSATVEDANTEVSGGDAAMQAPAGVASLTLESKLKIRSGRAMLIGGMSSSGSVESASKNLFVVATEIVED